MAGTKSKRQAEAASTGIIVLRVLVTVATLFTVAFIFNNSSEIASISGSRSAQVTAFLNRALGLFQIPYTLTEALVRKLAHFAEYALLGCLMLLTLRVYTKRVISFLSWPLFLGLLVPVSDEFYQTFIPGRAGAVMDVVIDFTGVCAGIVVALVLLLLGRMFRGR